MYYTSRCVCRPTVTWVGYCYVSLEINSNKQYQKVLGFGGAFTEASAINFAKLPKESRENLIEMYFGKSGIGFSMGRIAINSIDFGIESYNFDEISQDFKAHFVFGQGLIFTSYLIHLVHVEPCI